MDETNKLGGNTDPQRQGYPSREGGAPGESAGYAQPYGNAGAGNSESMTRRMDATPTAAAGIRPGPGPVHAARERAAALLRATFAAVHPAAAAGPALPAAIRAAAAGPALPATGAGHVLRGGREFRS
jgi:hypothetical protein